MTRTRRIHARLTDAEHQHLMAAAPEKTLSQAIRAAIALYIQAQDQLKK